MTKQTIEWIRGRAYTADATLVVEPSSSGGYVWAVLCTGQEVRSGRAETETAARQAAEQAVASPNGTQPFDFNQLDDPTLAALFHALLLFCHDVHSNPEEDVWERAEELYEAATAEMNRRKGYAADEKEHDNADG